MRRDRGTTFVLSVAVVLLCAVAAATGVMATSAVVFLLILAGVPAGVAALADRHQSR